MVTRIRRVTRTGTTRGPNNTERIQYVLQLIADNMLESSRLALLIKEEQEELFALMQSSKVKSAEVPIATAEIVTPTGKAQNLVDPKGLRKILTKDEEFFACISVGITKAKEYLSARELAKITTNIPAKDGDPVLKVSFKKVSK